MATKRKLNAEETSENQLDEQKQLQVSETQKYDLEHSQVAEKYGIINRAFYPPQIAPSRCDQYSNGTLSTPMAKLEATISQTAQRRASIAVGKVIIHWFKRDLRLYDNRALSLASDRAHRMGATLFCLFLISPEDYEAHLTSAAQVDFQLRSLEVVKADLAELNVPLLVETVHKRQSIPDRLVAICKQWSASHVFCNIEYEVDELRRETLLTRRCLSEGISFTAVHDMCVVTPGLLRTGDNKQFSVYTPWRRAWLAKIGSNPELLRPFLLSNANDSSARTKFEQAFEQSIPSAPANKSLTDEERTRFAALWPAGEHEASARLSRFLAEKVSDYQLHRNSPDKDTTSMLSVHFAAGTLSARTAVSVAREVNVSNRVDTGNPGLVKWVAEVAWRDFYKHVMVAWPFVCMNAAFKPAYATQIAWSYDRDNFEAWKQGRTGFPFVDAAMRQLLATGTMHNRARMVVASFLAKDLLIDWRLGEQHFMLSLADGDFASNNGGWAFSVGCGVDPQPFMRIFNPVTQGERFDGDGVYIRRWVPELVGVQGKAVHDPYGRGSAEVTRVVEERGYPRMIVQHAKSRERVIRVFGEGLRHGQAVQRDQDRDNDMTASALASAQATDHEGIDVGFLPG